MPPLSIKRLSTQIHGHRGCRGLFPENTLPAFLHALQLGVDVLEMDVVLSADHQVVVAHEPWLSAQLGLSPTSQFINSQDEQRFNIYKLPYATIRQSIVGTLPHSGFPEQKAVATYRPLLNEVLQSIETACQWANRFPIGYSIEIKSTPETEGKFHPVPTEFVATVLASIPLRVISRVTLLSFDVRILQVARQLQPTLRLCLLVENPFVIEKLFNPLGFVPDVFGPCFQLLDARIITAIRQQYTSLEIVPWTVNEIQSARCLAYWGVTGITTDYPNRLLGIV